MNRLKAALRPLIPNGITRARAERHFFSKPEWYSRHLGAFSNFAEASTYISGKAQPTDYSLEHDKWLKRRAALSSHDYPVLFWLSQLLPRCKHKTIVDFGGSVGVSYFAFQKFIDFPPALSWTVVELSDAVELGKQICAERQEPALRFTTELDAIRGADIFLAAGSLHYIEEPVFEILQRHTPLPRHLIINKMPLSPKNSFVTIESGAKSFYPCKIELESSFLESMNSLGYRLKDSWKCLEHKMDVIGHPQLSLSSYRGLLFSLE